MHAAGLILTPVQRNHFSALGIQSLVGIPLVLGEQLIGMLSVRMASDRRVDNETLEFAQALAEQATLAIELERLAEQAKQTALVIERERAARERAAELAKANEALRECLDASRPFQKSMNSWTGNEGNYQAIGCRLFNAPEA